ncbi:MAG TPA: hypothetical protein VIM41_08790 [Gammaproteobacteria bacterium]
MRNAMYFIALIVLTTSNVANGGWNGVGQIDRMYIYPAYTVVVQGNTGPGLAGCQDNQAWSFFWSKFDAPTQARIQSMLLTAYTAKLPIQVLVSDTTCGPEGKKEFTGNISFP